MSTSWPILLLFCGLLLAIVLILFWHPRLSRTKTGLPARRQPGNPVFRNDERYWAGGLFYSNPDDPALFIPKRLGLGWTMNFGHPRARLLLIGLLVLVVLPPLVVALFAIIAPGSVQSSGCHPSGCSPLP